MQVPAVDKIICSYPPNKMCPKQHAVYESDIKYLAPKSFITTGLVDFKFRHLQPNGPGGQDVWLLCNSLAQHLGGFWWDHPTFMGQIEAAKLYEKGGCKMVYMAWCESLHFFGVVGVCGEDVNHIYILESIGGYEEPLGVALLRTFMNELRARQSLKPVETYVKALAVPKQEPMSNNCGLFMIENATKIMNNSEEFVARAEKDQLHDWYSASDVTGRREEIAELPTKLGQEQRKNGELHEKEGDLVLPDLLVKVRFH